MNTTNIGIRGIGLIVGIVTAIVALVALLRDGKGSSRDVASRYEGWDDSLGV
jgi:hypothetical protein